jgi:hypothetical protein
MKLCWSQNPRCCALWMLVATVASSTSTACVTSTEEAEAAANADAGGVDSTEEAIVVAGTCKTTTPDCTLDTLGELCGSQNGGYGSAFCPHTFVVDVNYPAPGSLVVGYIGPILNDDTTFPCNSQWVTYKVLLEPGGFTALQGTLYGQNVGTTHQCTHPAAHIPLNRGSYRVLASAGFITTYEGVEVDESR